MKKVTRRFLTKSIVSLLLVLTMLIAPLALTACKDGQDGKDGAVWLTGTDAPAASLGKDGDLYRCGGIGAHGGGLQQQAKQIGEHIIFLLVLNIYFDFPPTQEHISFPRETNQSFMLTPPAPSQDHR